MSEITRRPRFSEWIIRRATPRQGIEDAEKPAALGRPYSLPIQNEPPCGLRIRAGKRELLARCLDDCVNLRLRPLEEPPDGLSVRIGVYQDSVELGSLKLKGVGVRQPVVLRIWLHRPRRGSLCLLRIRSNAEVRLWY